MPSAEEEYLESLWAEEDQYAGSAAQVPVLAKSQVFQRATRKDADQGDGTTALSTLRPKVQVPAVVPMWERETLQHSKPAMRDAEELRQEFDDVIHNLEERRDDLEAATLEATKAQALQSKIEEEIL